MKQSILVLSLLSISLTQAVKLDQCSYDDTCSPCCPIPALDCPSVPECVMTGASPVLPMPAGPGLRRACSAGTTTKVAAAQFIVPDKKAVTDQAKVTETCASSQETEQNCSNSRRKFVVDGGIQITTRENRNSQGEFSGSLNSQHRGEVIQREHTDSEFGGQIGMPRTCSCKCCNK